MKSIFSGITLILLLFLSTFTGCGEGEYNKSILDPSFTKESGTNDGLQVPNEYWEKENLNPSGKVISTDLDTGGTMEENIVSDDSGSNDSVDFSVTISELEDGRYTADGSIYIAPGMTFSGCDGAFHFFNLPVTFSNTASVEKQCYINGNSALTTDGRFSYSFEITLTEKSQFQSLCNAKVIDVDKNILIGLDVTIRRGGGDKSIAFPEN